MLIGCGHCYEEPGESSLCLINPLSMRSGISTANHGPSCGRGEGEGEEREGGEEGGEEGGGGVVRGRKREGEEGGGGVGRGRKMEGEEGEGEEGGGGGRGKGKGALCVAHQCLHRHTIFLTPSSPFSLMWGPWLIFSKRPTMLEASAY